MRAVAARDGVDARKSKVVSVLLFAAAAVRRTIGKEK